MAKKRSGKLASKSATARASNIKSATGRVKAKTSLNFSRSVRGK